MREKLYIVVVSGGYEAPSYQFTKEEDAAWDYAEEAAEEMNESDFIDVIEVDLVDLNSRRLHGRSY